MALFSPFVEVKMLDEELLKCYNLKHNYRAKYLQNKQKKEKRNEICCDFKQIPDDSIKDEYQDVDQLNDSDKNVIKEALDLRDRYGGTVDVIGFGPLSAEDVMKETLTYGIDDAFLISDPQFADMDVSQVAKIVAAVIKKLDPYDLVLCGRQAIDGDSAHMASMTSCALEIPLIAYSDEITRDERWKCFCNMYG